MQTINMSLLREDKRNQAMQLNAGDVSDTRILQVDG